MQSVARASPTSGRAGPYLTKLLLKPIARLLQTGDPAVTVDRLFRSRHVKDLQLIIAVAFGAVLLVFVLGVPLSFENQLMSQWPGNKDHLTVWFVLRILFEAMGKFLTFYAPVVTIFGAVLAWAYQVGSARLGVVDLFACEISTLCRVATILDTVRRCVDRFDHGPPEDPAGAGEPLVRQFTSQENYFPVFESCTRDLQTLEARVVINVTAFYTFMKAVRDSMRTLAEIRPQPSEFESPSGKIQGVGPWHEAARNVVYMLFLSLESARNSIADLVEFEPEKAERIIVILISELEAYHFLSIQFTDGQEMHHARLKLREHVYRDVVPQIWRSVEAGTNSERATEREPAWLLVPELKDRFRVAIPSINP